MEQDFQQYNNVGQAAGLEAILWELIGLCKVSYLTGGWRGWAKNERAWWSAEKESHFRGRTSYYILMKNCANSDESFTIRPATCGLLIKLNFILKYVAFNKVFIVFHQNINIKS